MSEASPGDGAIEQDAFERRFWNQVNVLVELGASCSDAEEIIDAIRPTGGGFAGGYFNDYRADNLVSPEATSREGNVL